MTTLAPELLAGLVERAGRPDFDAFEAQLRSSGHCARPIRLQGKIETSDRDGQRRVWSTETEPDGVLRKGCGNRREAVCPPCAERYRQDAYHLIAAGLRGGKGLPQTVTEHPAVFATLTAPSFGVVHVRPLGPGGDPGRCRPRRDAPVCRHGVALSCTAVHAQDDPCLGEPLCPRCFDYAAAVTWNNMLGELWRYTTIYVPRAMARLCGMTQVALRQEVRPAYVKVAEYQRRGLVHLHVLARLDRAMPEYRAEEIRPPASRFEVELLERAIREAVADVSAPLPVELGRGRVRWGSQLDVRRLSTGAERGEIAGYLAKYATKGTEQAGGLLHRIAPDQVDDVQVRDHVRVFLRTAFELDATVAEARASRMRGGMPAPDVETDWNPAALASRLHRAMGTDELLRVRPHEGDAQLGRVVAVTGDAPARKGTTLAVELDSGVGIHLADVASIGPGIRRMGRRDRRDPRLGACAHAFGYRGHCLTKSRRYSVTFKALREAREAFVHEQILAGSRDATQRAIAAADAETRTATFTYVGVGHVTAADAYLAASAAARAREQRRIGREECRVQLAAADGVKREVGHECRWSNAGRGGAADVADAQRGGRGARGELAALPAARAAVRAVRVLGAAAALSPARSGALGSPGGLRPAQRRVGLAACLRLGTRRRAFRACTPVTGKRAG